MSSPSVRPAAPDAQPRGLSVRLVCGYSNCFRDAVKRRGFMPVCEVHLRQPKKWGADGRTFTGSTWRRA